VGSVGTSEMRPCTIAILRKTYMKKLASFFSIIYLAAAFAFGNELTIQREYSSAACVSGYLLVNGEAICYVLERPWQNNAAVISAIPAGKYSAFILEDGAKGWRIELFDVPGREHIQIHYWEHGPRFRGLQGQRLG